MGGDHMMLINHSSISFPSSHDLALSLEEKDIRKYLRTNGSSVASEFTTAAIILPLSSLIGLVAV
jgi:hypothetical protein